LTEFSQRKYFSKKTGGIMSIELKEKDYNDLYKYSLNIAHKFIGYDESAYDIAQNALLQLISTKNEITSPYAWLRTVVKRESLKIYEENKKNKEITINKQLMPQPAKQHVEEDPDAIPMVDDKVAKEALSSDDYKIYIKFKKLNFNIQKYSEKEKMSYNTASFQKQRIKRNILSRVLWDDGWRYSNKVLNYAQFNNINRFIRTIIKSVTENSVSTLINYLRGIEPDLVVSIFADVAEIREWAISYQVDRYRLLLICLSENHELIVPVVYLNFDKKNYLHVLRIDKGETHLIEDDNPDIDLSTFTEKGELKLSVEEVLDLLKYSK
jgi:hypothetical protein